MTRIRGIFADFFPAKHYPRRSAASAFYSWNNNGKAVPGRRFYAWSINTNLICFSLYVTLRGAWLRICYIIRLSHLCNGQGGSSTVKRGHANSCLNYMSFALSIVMTYYDRNLINARYNQHRLYDRCNYAFVCSRSKLQPIHQLLCTPRFNVVLHPPQVLWHC